MVLSETHFVVSPTLREVRAVAAHLDRIELKLDVLVAACERMNSHIGFVESVYARVRSPFNWLFAKIGFGGSVLSTPTAQASLTLLNS